MTQATLFKKINKTTGEMQELIQKSKRKLLELEVLTSFAEVKQDKVKNFKTAKDLWKKLK